MNQEKLKSLLPEVVDAARVAAEKILLVYQREDFETTIKSDKSPLTEADLASHNSICNTLAKLTPDIPILSEESQSVPYETRKQWQLYWLVDPLDGTKEFIKRNGEFTTNIALIENHKPILGVVGVPVTGVIYYAADGIGVHKQERDGSVKQISTQKPPATPLRVAGSRSHQNEETQAYLAQLGDHEWVAMGSSLKFCLIAEGSADLYPRLGPTSEWDTAAAHAVLNVAGGSITTVEGEALRYNTKDSLLNPYFIARSTDS